MRRACGISLGRYYLLFWLLLLYSGTVSRSNGPTERIQAMLLLDLGSSKLAYALPPRTTRCMIRLLCVAVRKNTNFGGLLLEQRRAVSYVLLSMAIHIGCWCCHRDATLCALQELHVSMMTTIGGRRQRPVCGQSPSKSIGRLNRT